MNTAELRKKIKQSRHNFCRQRAREVERRDVRVSSAFWNQVEREYRQRLAKAIRGG